MFKFIKSQDYFGHQVSWKFKNKTTHNTVVGGFASVFIKTLVLIYTALAFKKLIFGEDDKYESVICA